MADFEQDWEALKGSQETNLLRGSLDPHNYTKNIEEARLKTIFDIQGWARKQDLPEETRASLVTAFERSLSNFAMYWQETYETRRDVAGIVEFLLARLHLEPSELHAFLRAIPTTLIRRVCQNIQGSGVHALFVLEAYFREGDLKTDYEVYRDEAGQLTVSFLTPNQQRCTFELHEKFPL